jgi:hypothetical protein
MRKIDSIQVVLELNAKLQHRNQEQFQNCLNVAASSDHFFQKTESFMIGMRRRVAGIEERLELQSDIVRAYTMNPFE